MSQFGGFSGNTGSSNSLTPAPWLGPAAEAASGLFGSIFGNIGARRRQNRANKQNIKFWNMQNEYNSPTSQMQRLREAGLNPNLIYGDSVSGASGRAENIAPSKAAPYEIDNPLRNITQFADIKQRNAQTDNLKQQNSLIQQQKILTSNQSQKVGTENALKQVELGISPDLLKTQLQALKANVKRTEQETWGRFLDNNIKNQSTKNLVLDIKYRVEIARESLKGIELTNMLKKYETELNKLGIQKTDNKIFRFIFGDGNWMDAVENKFKN